VAIDRAAKLLSTLFNVLIIPPIPKVSMLSTGDLRNILQLADKQDTVSAVCQGFMGNGISGEGLLVFNDSSITDIASLMKYKGDINDKTEIELLTDITSILIGACLKGISEQLNIGLRQGHPVVLGSHRRVTDLINTSPRWKNTLAIEFNYKIENHEINCDLLLLFTEDTVKVLNKIVSSLKDQP
jgi:chemotaxis protein CheY-P-specific phosphatase CheC